VPNGYILYIVLATKMYYQRIDINIFSIFKFIKKMNTFKSVIKTVQNNITFILKL